MHIIRLFDVNPIFRSFALVPSKEEASQLQRKNFGSCHTDFMASAL